MCDLDRFSQSQSHMSNYIKDAYDSKPCLRTMTFNEVMLTKSSSKCFD